MSAVPMTATTTATTPWDAKTLANWAEPHLATVEAAL